MLFNDVACCFVITLLVLALIGSIKVDTDKLTDKQFVGLLVTLATVLVVAAIVVISCAENMSIVGIFISVIISGGGLWLFVVIDNRQSKCLA